MPSKKQRRRREKLKRHEWEFVEVGADGTEVPLEAAQVRKPDPKEKGRSSGRSRPRREVKPPSWNRAIKRALLFVPFLFIFLSLGKSPPPLSARVSISILYAAIFVPMFFFVDRIAYRAYKRRVAGD